MDELEASDDLDKGRFEELEETPPVDIESGLQSNPTSYTLSSALPNHQILATSSTASSVSSSWRHRRKSIPRAPRWELVWKPNRTSASQDIDSYIEVEFYTLVSSTIHLPGLLMPEQLLPVGPNLCQQNIIDFVVDDEELWGLRIVNHSKEDLFVNAFLFDNTDFSIGETQCSFSLFEKMI